MGGTRSTRGLGGPAETETESSRNSRNTRRGGQWHEWPHVATSNDYR